MMVENGGVSEIAAFTLGGAGGLADLLRSNKKLTRRAIATAVIYNGLSAMAVAWLAADKLQGQLGIIYALCILSGIGAASVLDVLVSGVRAKLGGAPPAR